MIKLPKTINMFGDEVALYVDRYADNGRIAVIAQSTQGEPYGVLSVNLPEESCLCDYEFFAKNYMENEQLYVLALNTGMFECIGFCKGFPILKFKEEYRHLISFSASFKRRVEL
jgi:hypothetical protein